MFDPARELRAPTEIFLKGEVLNDSDAQQQKSDQPCAAFSPGQ
jgi:hypothetical protein